MMKKSNCLAVILVITFSILANSCNSSTYGSGDNDTSITSPQNSSDTRVQCPVNLTVLGFLECQEAPEEMGKFYKRIAFFKGGEVLQVIGVNIDKSWWAVLTPKSGQQCWIEARRVETEGETSCVPIITPGPDITPIAPPARQGRPPF